MADISTGMKVTGLSQYKSAMQQAQQSVKTLDAQLKKTEAQYKATGDKEQYMSDKSDTLKKKLNEQQKAAAQAQKALDAMRAQGVDPASKSFQQMEQQLLKAQTGVLQTTTEINNLTVSEQEAAKGADQLTTSVNGISKKISLDQVIKGVDAITTGLENAAKRAAQFGQELLDAVMESARWADDTATQASILNMDVEDYQRYRKVFDTIGELTVQDWMKAKQKVQKAINDPTKDQTDILSLLGINTHEMIAGKRGWVEGAARPFEDVLWEIGETLRAKVESGELTQDLADTYGTALFGRNFSSFNPLFKLGRTAFSEALEQQNVVTEESVNTLADMNDKLITLQSDFRDLQTEVLAGLAPALTKAAEVLDGLLGRMMDFLKTEDGQRMLASLSESVSALFADLGKIDPENVVKNFTNVFNAVIESFKWLVENKDNIIHALEGIVIGWAGLKLTGGALQIYQMISGIKGLTGANLGNVVNRIFGNGSPGAPTHSAADIASAMAQTVQTLIGGTIGGVALGDYMDDFMNFHHAESFEDLQKMVFERFNLPEDKLPIPVEPEVQENAAEDVAKQVGIVTLPAHLRIMGGGIGLGSGGENLTRMLQESSVPVYGHANGLPFVPWDGYIAMLHRGERVLTASANRSYTANSNLYVENMNMNNGMDAQALAAAMNAQNQRIRSGFGS